LVVPGLVVVVDDRGSQAPRRVDAGAGDGDGGQVHHEHGEPNWERSQHLHIYRSKEKNIVSAPYISSPINYIIAISLMIHNIIIRTATDKTGILLNVSQKKKIAQDFEIAACGSSAGS
jgi:hypothetical protein